MTNLSDLLECVKDKIYYSQPTYIAGYEAKPWKKWIFGSLLILFLLFLIGNNHENNKIQSSTKTPSASAKISKIPINSATPQIKTSVLPTYSVVKVVDGDTIDVNINSKVERVRLIGIDTPETVDPRKPIQCFGKEASAHAKSTLTGLWVSLESDSSQGNTDKYNRLLRYVLLPDGTNFNEKMIREGYAHEYTYKLPYKYMDKFKAAERLARNSSSGLWADNTCSGNTSQPVTINNTANMPSTPLSPTPTQSSLKKSPSTTASSSGVYFANCSAARAAGAAPILRGQVGYRSALDRDSDGIACE